MQKSLHIYVCSTFRDLVRERKAIFDGLEKLGSQFEGLSFSCSKSIQSLENCKDEIGRSHVLVLLVGHLQGVITPGQDLSYAEAEYNEGAALGKNILVYFRDEKTGIYPVHFERDQSRAQQLKAFKRKLEANHNPKTFTDLVSLVTLINQDISSLASEFGLESKIVFKNMRFKSQTSITRKIPITNRPLVHALPENPQTPEHSTRTLPVFQKALATPFYRRKSGMTRTSKVILLAIGLVIASSITLAEFRKLSNSKPVLEKQESLVLAKPTIPKLEPITETITETILETVPEQPGPTVLLMDDTDTSKVILRKAVNGSASDQFLAGQIYEDGKIVRRNDSIAFRWYRKAAEQGWPEAQYKTALMYRKGQGTARSSFQAARWFKAAADQGFSKAQVKLGQLYQTGKGVTRNEATAFKWFLKAAEQKDPDAEKILAELKEQE
jgi:Domain of unknown function (DUF4062)/Sel1 repeat